MSAEPQPQPTRIAVVDYGAGNLVSIEQALTSVGASVTVARDGEGLRDVDAVVVPGVGAAGPAMARLEAGGLVDPHPCVDRSRSTVPRDLPRPPGAIRRE